MSALTMRSSPLAGADDCHSGRPSHRGSRHGPPSLPAPGATQADGDATRARALDVAKVRGDCGWRVHRHRTVAVAATTSARG